MTSLRGLIRVVVFTVTLCNANTRYSAEFNVKTRSLLGHEKILGAEASYRVVLAYEVKNAVASTLGVSMASVKVGPPKSGDPGKVVSRNYHVIVWTKDKKEIDLVDNTLNDLVQREIFREKLKAQLLTTTYFKGDTKPHVWVLMDTGAVSGVEENGDQAPPGHLGSWAHERKELTRRMDRNPATSIAPQTMTLSKLICAAGLLIWAVFNLVNTRGPGKGATQPTGEEGEEYGSRN
jgi:hypothetical protein